MPYRRRMILPVAPDEDWLKMIERSSRLTCFQINKLETSLVFKQFITPIREPAILLA